MRNFPEFIYLILAMSFSGFLWSESNKLPEHVVKVTLENNPKCIEYLRYHGDMYCSLVPLDKTSFDPQLMAYEQQNVHFDERPWKAAWGERKEYITSIEYIPIGQNINNWQELVTTQFIPGVADVSAKQFAQRFLADLKKSHVVYTFNILSEQKNIVIFEFQVHKPKNLQQDEIQKIVKGPKGLYILHYAIKKENMSSHNRSEWLNNLQQSTLKESVQ